MLLAGGRSWTRAACAAVSVLVLSTACGRDPGPTVAVPVAAEIPGVSDSTVRIGFVVLDFGTDPAAIAQGLATRGDVEAESQALTDWLNDEGGLGGRKVEPVFYRFDATSSSVERDQQMCDYFSAQEPVFAVIMEGSFQKNLRPCLAERNVLMLDSTLYPVTEDEREDLAPYYISPALPVYDQLFKPWIAMLTETGFLGADAKLGVLANGSLENKRLYARLVGPALRHAGVTDVMTEFVDTTNGMAMQGALAKVAARFRDAGVNRVISVGGSQMISSFVDDGAKPLGYRPRLALSGYDDLDPLKIAAPEYLVDSVAVSIHPTRDLDPEGPASPFSNASAACYQLFADDQVTFTSKRQSTVGLHYCDAARLLHATLSEADQPDAKTVHDGLADLDGQYFELSSSWATSFADGATGGASGFRAVLWEADCSCMKVQDGSSYELVP